MLAENYDASNNHRVPNSQAWPAEIGTMTREGLRERSDLSMPSLPMALDLDRCEKFVLPDVRQTKPRRGEGITAPGFAASGRCRPRRPRAS